MTRPHERTRALRWAGDFLHELSQAPGTSPEHRERIELILRHYPSDVTLALQARMDAQGGDPFLLPEPEGSPARPADVLDPQGMATWENDAGVLRVECASGLRVSVQPSPASQELNEVLANFHDKLVTARDLLGVEPWLRQLDFRKAPARPPEMTLWRAIGLNTRITLHGVPEPAGGAYAELDRWQDFLDSH